MKFFVGLLRMPCERFSAAAGWVSHEEFRARGSLLQVMEGFLMDVSLEEEVAGVQLGDKRLTDRLAVIVDRCGSHPNLSIPAAMQGRSELEAAYRFFANENVATLLSTSVKRKSRPRSRKKSGISDSPGLTCVPWRLRPSNEHGT